MADVSVKVYVEKLANLVHNDANPRLIKTKKYKELMKSLKEFPQMKLIREIVIDENNLILAGDKRTLVLEELGYTDVTVKKVFGLSEAQKREFIAKDNIHSGDWDKDILANEWDLEELKEWGAPDFTLPAGDDKPKDDYKNHEVTCPHCGEHFSLKDTE